jgi:hypothetical protein
LCSGIAKADECDGVTTPCGRGQGGGEVNNLNKNINLQHSVTLKLLSHIKKLQ